MSNFITILKPVRKKGAIKSKYPSYVQTFKLTIKQKSYILAICKELNIPFSYFVKWVVLSSAYAIKNKEVSKDLDILIKKDLL